MTSNLLHYILEAALFHALKSEYNIVHTTPSFLAVGGVVFQLTTLRNGLGH